MRIYQLFQTETPTQLREFRIMGQDLVESRHNLIFFLISNRIYKIFYHNFCFKSKTRWLCNFKCDSFQLCPAPIGLIMMFTIPSKARKQNICLKKCKYCWSSSRTTTRRVNYVQYVIAYELFSKTDFLGNFLILFCTFFIIW